MTSIIYTRKNPGEFAEKEIKHVPIISIIGSTIIIKVGEEEHPMEEAHYIQWIALYYDGEELARQELQPGKKPEATFENIENPEKVQARASCNLHGVWGSD